MITALTVTNIPWLLCFTSIYSRSLSHYHILNHSGAAEKIISPAILILHIIFKLILRM